eukprot:1176779-Rhodomonas_salina.1
MPHVGCYGPYLARPLPHALIGFDFAVGHHTLSTVATLAAHAMSVPDIAYESRRQTGSYAISVPDIAYGPGREIGSP